MRNPLGSTVSTAMHSSSVPRQPPPAATSLPRYYQGRAAAPAGSRRLQAVSEQIGSVSRELTAQQIADFERLEALLDEKIRQECQDSTHGEVANGQDLERVTASCGDHLTAGSTVLDSAGPEVLLSRFGTITQLGLVFRKRGDRTLMHPRAAVLLILDIHTTGMEPCFGSVFFVHAQLENVHGYAWFVGGKRWCWGRAGGTGRPARVGCGGGGAKPFRVTFVSAPRVLFWSHGCDVALHAFHGRVRHQKRSRATQPAPAHPS